MSLNLGSIKTYSATGLTLRNSGVTGDGSDDGSDDEEPSSVNADMENGPHFVTTNTSVSIENKLKALTSQTSKVYTPSLVLSYVRSKMNRLEKKKLEVRLSHLRYIFDTCDETEQFALQDLLIKEMAVVIRQQEVAACGFDLVVRKEFIDRFRNRSKVSLDWQPLEKFPRLIPDRVRRKIQVVKAKHLFDNYTVLYCNPTQEELKTTKEKVIDKDPILFGSFEYDPTNFYFIADWEDPLCDLTFEKFVDQVKQTEPSFELGRVEPLSMKDIVQVKKRAKEQFLLLKSTSAQNWRRNAGLEDISRHPFSWDLVKRTLKALMKSLFNKKKV
jgi:hypothetical protein